MRWTGSLRGWDDVVESGPRGQGRVSHASHNGRPCRWGQTVTATTASRCERVCVECYALHQSFHYLASARPTLSVVTDRGERSESSARLMYCLASALAAVEVDTKTLPPPRLRRERLCCNGGTGAKACVVPSERRASRKYGFFRRLRHPVVSVHFGSREPSTNARLRTRTPSALLPSR